MSIDKPYEAHLGNYGSLRPGGQYRILKSFHDMDMHSFVHGQILTFLGHEYATYSQLDLFHWLSGDRKILMRFDEYHAESNRRILKNLDAHFERIDCEPEPKHARRPNKAKLRKAKINQHRKH